MDRSERTNDDLVATVAALSRAYLGGEMRSGRVLRAMRAVDRAAFLPLEYRREAYRDEPVAIGYGQTCSEPSMVAFMADMLNPEPGHRVLEVGSGCGYASAVLACMVRPGGSVTAAEIIPELAVISRANLSAWADVEVLEADGSDGLPLRGPWDRILLSAGVRRGAFTEAPLLAALTAEGVLVYPEARGAVYRIRMTSSGPVRDKFYGVAFVPLTGRNS